MFVSKKKYELVLSRYELAASRADQAEQVLAQLYGMALKYGGLYKCILECRGPVAHCRETAWCGCQGGAGPESQYRKEQ